MDLRGTTEQGNLMICTPHPILFGCKSRRMRWAGHVARMEERRVVYSVLVGQPEGRGHLEYPDVDGRIILRWICGKWGMDWINLALDRDMWRALVNAVMNIRVP